MIKKKWLGVAAILVVIISVTAFAISDAISHPAEIATVKDGGQKAYLVEGTGYHTVNFTMGKANLTLYLQFLTPGGPLSNNIPFLIEVYAFVVAHDSTPRHIMINVVVNHAYLNNTSISATDAYFTVLNGTIFQSLYHSVSANEPVRNPDQFSANVTVSLFGNLGPYYYLAKKINCSVQGE